MEHFAALRLFHETCAALSLSLFLLRCGLAQWAPAALKALVLRVLPHVIDTAFLASGLTMAALIRQYPFVDGWLTAKVFGLIAYIILGSLALKRAKTGTARLAFALLATAVFFYIVGVALRHDPRSWLA